MSSETLCLRARWVFPVAGPPLRDAAVTICDGLIVAVGPPPRDAAIEDLGEAALLPGLVNAHTHLEFSDLAAPIGRPGMGLVEWLASVLQHRAASPSGGPAAVELGLRESLGHGVTTIGEIGQKGSGLLSLGQRATALAPSSARNKGPTPFSTLFLELIAPRVERIATALAAAEEHVASGENGRWQPGLSPHAPYTVHPQLLARVVELSARRRTPLAMHLAESREELEFLRDGGGPFRELLESRGGWDPAARPPGARPLDELRALSGAHRALVVHGNYLDDEEIDFLGRQRDRMAVVYCPRTHAWFGHERYPLEKLRAAGAVVALGTDSRASSPNLSLLDEMRHVARAFPAMSRAAILEMGTLNGARALGFGAAVGTLQPGKLANLAAVALPRDRAADPHELLLDAGGAVVGAWVLGKEPDKAENLTPRR